MFDGDCFIIGWAAALNTDSVSYCLISRCKKTSRRYLPPSLHIRHFESSVFIAVILVRRVGAVSCYDVAGAAGCGAFGITGAAACEL